MRMLCSIPRTAALALVLATSSVALTASTSADAPTRVAPGNDAGVNSLFLG
jgi:hypothetical protein